MDAGERKCVDKWFGMFGVLCVRMNREGIIWVFGCTNRLYMTVLSSILDMLYARKVIFIELLLPVYYIVNGSDPVIKLHVKDLRNSDRTS